MSAPRIESGSVARGRERRSQSDRAVFGRTSPPRLRVAFALGRVEGFLLARNVLVLGGFVVSLVVAWSFLTRGEPLWWNAAWQIGYAQMVLSGVVVVAAHLAAGRARRDNMEDLYDSFPASAGLRTAGHLLSVLGAVPASLLLVAAAYGMAAWRGVFGGPDPAVLAAGLLLVVAGGLIGVAVGLRFPHPFAGIIAALAWAAPFTQSNRFNSAVTWLFPWVISQQSGRFPHPVPGYPPGAAHAAELAGIAGLAGLVALAWRARTAIQRGALAAAGAAALTVICLAGASQLQPIPTATVDRLVAQAATPTAYQTCSTTNTVRYCLYPAFTSLRDSLETPVNAVLAYVPRGPNQTLTVEQSMSVLPDDAALTHGHPAAQIATWTKQLENAPVNHPNQTAIFVGVGTWPPSSSGTAARLQLALAAADWAVGLPPSAGALATTTPCVPFNQAREPVAIWITLEATHTKVTGVQDLGDGPGYLSAPGPEITGAGYLLAQAMTKLPADKVTRVVDQRWSTWTNPHSTDAQLAAALGIALPATPTLVPTPGPRMKVSTAPGAAPTPRVCT